MNQEENEESRSRGAPTGYRRFNFSSSSHQPRRWAHIKRSPLNMMRLTLLPLVTALLVCLLCACDRKDNSAPSPLNQKEQKAGPLGGDSLPPENLDEALAILMSKLTPERKAYIEAGGEEYAFCAIDESVLPRDQPMLDFVPPSGETPLRRFFLRLGVYHGEDMWLILNTALSRKVRVKPIGLEEQIAELRRHWAEQDIVSPLDLRCPRCGKELVVAYEHDGVSTAHPKRVYFSGHCPDGSVFYYYHKDGWRPESEIKAKPAQTDGDKPSN